MGKLLIKEIKLAMHPTAPLFLMLSAMLLIPNYPYYVIFFYTGLAVFFTCLTGRENKDVFFTCLLPVKKSDVVKARFILVLGLEVLQILIAVPFAVLRQKLQLPPNAVGMEANLGFFGFTLVLLGIFHLVFFGIYYKDVSKVGKAFVVSSIAVFVYMGIAETLVHAVPFFIERIDTYDTVYVKEKLVILAIGILLYLCMTGIAYKNAVRNFKLQDII